MVEELGLGAASTPGKRVHDMDGNAAPGRKRPPDWVIVRAEYEGRLFHPALICERHGITPAQLRYRRQCEGWLSVRARIPTRLDLVSRMLRVLEQQVRELEMAKDMPIEKRAKLLADHVKALDKLIDKGAARPNVAPPSRKDMSDLRAKLVKRLEQSGR